MDEIDSEIIRILCNDARTPFKKIGKMLGIGTDTVFRRFDKLKKEGIITGSTIILSSKACGIKGLCGLFIKLKSGSNSSIVKDKLMKTTWLIMAHPTWGEYDFYVDLFFRDFQEIADVIAILRKIKEVVSIEPMMYTLQEWSIPFAMPLETEITPIWAFDIQK